MFAAVYLALRNPGGSLVGWRGGALYGAAVSLAGAAVSLAGALPVYLLAFAAFAVSPEVIACWVAQSLCQYVAAGAAIGAVTGNA